MKELKQIRKAINDLIACCGTYPTKIMMNKSTYDQLNKKYALPNTILKDIYGIPIEVRNDCNKIVII